MSALVPRPTARVLLLDPDGRILLMRGRLTRDPAAPAFWFTVGGGVEDGETVLEAAAREIVEETGFTDAILGPLVALREAVVTVEDGVRLHVQEIYFVARCAGGEPARDGWQDLERALIDDMRWWSLDELSASPETVFPPGLPELLADVLEDRATDLPRRLEAVHPANR